MRYGYARVSTKGQQRYGMSLDEQQDQLSALGIPPENIYVDAYTGGEMKRPNFDALMRRLQSGDEFVVCKMDRFARTTPEGSLIVRELVARGVRVNILNMGIADNTPTGKMFVTMMLAFAEYERDMILERTAMGKAYKKAHDPDYREGRKEIAIDDSLFEQCRKKQKDGTMTVEECCSVLQISRSTWYNRVRAAG